MQSGLSHPDTEECSRPVRRKESKPFAVECRFGSDERGWREWRSSKRYRTLEDARRGVECMNRNWGGKILQVRLKLPS